MVEDSGISYAESRIGNRQMDTLSGLAKGIVADGVVTQAEAEMLLNWLANNRYIGNVVFETLLDRLGAMLSDGLLDNDEQADLLQTLTDFAGDPEGMGELLRSASLPLDDPAPEVVFEGRSFLFTGTSAYGRRKDCQEFVVMRGGTNAKSVTRDLDYLVIGLYVTRSWKHERYGRKIETAMSLRNRSGRPAILSESALWPIGI